MFAQGVTCTGARDRKRALSSDPAVASKLSAACAKTVKGFGLCTMRQLLQWVINHVVPQVR